MKRFSLAILLFVAAVAPGAELNVQGLSLHPPRFELVGSRATLQLLVSARMNGRTFADLTRQAEFTSLDPSVATVDSKGRVKARGDGRTEILARYGTVTVRSRVTVSKYAETRLVDFRTDVIASLARGGCSQGACHGSPQGKNGFRLSLRGYDPAVDIHYLTKDEYGRRLNRVSPNDSLILEKAAARAAHQGGKRLRETDTAYQVIRQWIAEGHQDSKKTRKVVELIPHPRERALHRDSPTQQITVTALFDDGSRQDVTDLTVFESPLENENGASVTKGGLVEFERTAEAAILLRYLDKILTVRLSYIRTDDTFKFASPVPANYVDRLVFAKQKQLQLRPSHRADDGVFLRRVYLDLVGGIPTPDEAKRFLTSTDPQKRARLVNELLRRPEFAQFWALKWADVMRGNRQAITLRGVHNLHRYLVRNFAADRPFDKVAAEIIESRGDTINYPQANFYRISRTPIAAAESFSQLFLGIRIQCAKCHNHPFEAITQQDYYGLAAHFARVTLKGKRFGLDKEVVLINRTGEVQMPGTKGNMVPSAFGIKTEIYGKHLERRARLARWLVNDPQKFFARSTVNRVWFHLMGQGIVDPIDDFRDSNPPSNPELLDALADQFVKEGYRFRPIIRAIVNSTTYQLASPGQKFVQSQHSANPSRYFTRPIIKMLSAEQIIDAISMATDIPEKFPGYPLGTKAISMAEGETKHRFLQAFTKPIRDVACDCARDTEPTMNQVVHLLNNKNVLAKIKSSRSRLGRWLKQDMSNRALAERLYLATLSRLPTEREHQLVQRHIENSRNRGEACRDLLHALINSNEFLLRH